MEGGARPGGDGSEALRHGTAQWRHARGSGDGESGGGQRKSGDQRRGEGRWRGNLTGGGGARPGSDGGVACSDTHGRERGAASDRLSGWAAGQRFMAQAHAWQRCRGSRREQETEHQRVGPHT
jgi:hypothetical protein